MSVAGFQPIETGTPVPIPRPVGSVTRGGEVTGGDVSMRTVIAAVPMTPFAEAVIWAVPASVATKWPAASIVPIGGETDQAT
jgi:hypothetical protein